MIIASSGALGLFVRKSLKNRYENLRGILLAIDIFQAEIVFRRATLEDAIAKITQSVGGMVGAFFKEVSMQMEQHQTFADGFETALPKLAKSGLVKSDTDLFHDLTGVLGRYDSLEQAQMLKNIRVNFEAQFNQSRDELLQKGKLYSALGVSFGIMLALMAV